MGLTASGLDVRVLKREWLSNVGPDILAGLLVALALIPEAIGFTIYAGLDPKIGLFASFTMSVTIAIFGGRTAMISGAAGALALLFKPLVASHGFDYVIATTILTGILQIIWSAIGLGKQLRYCNDDPDGNFADHLERDRPGETASIYLAWRHGGLR